MPDLIVTDADLLPCPFCGRGGNILHICETQCSWNEDGMAYAVTCRTRDCHGAIFSLGYDLFRTEAEAIAAWNNRATLARPADAEVEGLVERLRELLAKATPGPWKACPSREWDWFAVYPKTGKAEFPIATEPLLGGRSYIKARHVQDNFALIVEAINALPTLLATLSSGPVAVPIDMILHCPACHLQHIDAPGGEWEGKPWDNPPHKSHLCLACGHIWRPADVPTNGVEAIKTKGSADSSGPVTAETEHRLSWESGWLIEMVEPEENKPPVPRWWHPEHGWMWDANKALRFARQIDAADHIKSCHLIGKPTEHRWM